MDTELAYEFLIPYVREEFFQMCFITIDDDIFSCK